MDFRIEGNSIAFELEIDGAIALARMDGGEWTLTLCDSERGMHLCQGRVSIDEVIKRAITVTKVESAGRAIQRRRHELEYGTKKPDQR